MSQPRVLEHAGEWLEARSTRLFLAAMILLSVMPLGWLEPLLWPLFLGVFGTELALRLLLHLQRRRQPPAERDSSRPHHAGWERAVAREEREAPGGERANPDTERIFLVIDVLVVISFLPLDRWIGASPVSVGILTVLRLARLLLLLRFARAVAQDIYSILTRREQLQQFGLVTLGVAGLALVSAVVLEQLQIAHPYSGLEEAGDGFYDRLWWAFRQLESADNLVQNLRAHPLIVALSLLLTITGVFIISFIIGLGANIVAQVVRAERRRPVGYRGHTLVVGALEGRSGLVREFVRIYDKHRALQQVSVDALWDWLRRRGAPPRRHALPRMALLGRHEDLPGYLYESLMRWVVYRQGEGSDPRALRRVGANQAKRLLLLAPIEGGADADAAGLVALAAFRAVNRTATVYMEVLSSSNCSLVREVGGHNTFPLDVPRFLGLFLCQHLLVPGVDGLYQDLLTSEGSEFYTHVFLEPREHEALERIGPDQGLSFTALADWAFRQFGVTLVGVLLGDRRVSRLRNDAIPVAGLVTWLNPLIVPGDLPEIAGLGGQPDWVPCASLCGLIGIADSYIPLKKLGRHLLHTELPRLVRPAPGLRTAAPPPPAPDGSSSTGPGAAAAPDAESGSADDWLLRTARANRGALKRVLVVGCSVALPALLLELSRFVPKVELVLVFTSAGHGECVLQQHLEELNLGITHHDPLPGELGRLIALPRGGHVRIFTTDRRDLADFAARCLCGLGSADAAIFLSEPVESDRDAQTALRLLRFARALELNQTPRGERIHLLAEFSSLSRGLHIQEHLWQRGCGYSSAEHLRLTLVSTEQIKNYFMVHSAFVPGVTGIYDELLSERGQEIVRLDLEPGAAPALETRVEAILAALWKKGVLPIALERLHGEVLLNPPPSTVISLRDLRCVYAIADERLLDSTGSRLSPG